MKYLIPFLLIVFLNTSCTLIDRFKPREEIEIAPAIAGTWRLVTYKGEDKEGRFHYPFNDNVLGQAMFDAKNNYSIQFYDADREVFRRSDPFFSSDPEIRIAFLTARSAFGTYEINGENLILSSIASNIPNRTGIKEERPYIVQGDSMLMRSSPIRLNGIEMIEHTLWVRK